MDGKRERMREGIRKGRIDGLREGERKGQNNMLYSLVQDGSLDIEVAAKKINLSVDEFVKAMKAAGAHFL